MEFDTLDEQLTFVMNRFLSFISGFLPPDAREQVKGLSDTVKKLTAVKISEMGPGLAKLDSKSAIDELVKLFPSHEMEIRTISSRFSQEDEMLLRRYVTVISAILA